MDRAWGRVLGATAIVLALSSAMLVVGQALTAWGFPGSSTRMRLELLSQVAGVGIGLLVLGAGLLALAGNDVRPWLLRVVVVLGALLALAGIFAVVDILTIHIPSPGATGQRVVIGLSSGARWLDRWGLILQRAAGGLLGGWAAWLAAEPLELRRRVGRPAAV
jgi:hypothetical protein